MTQIPPQIKWDRESGQAMLANGRLELIIETRDGLNAKSLRDTQTGQAYADRDYSWPGGVFPHLEGAPKLTKRSISFGGRLGALRVEQTFSMPKDEPGVVLETIKILNDSVASLQTADFQCGFTKFLGMGEMKSAGAVGVRLCPVPYRRETSGQMQEFSLYDIAEKQSGYAGWAEPFHPTATWGAEGWVWSEGSSTLLVAKYNHDSMEWSLMEPFTRNGETELRFGGAGQWKHGSPEGSARLRPGQSYTFGETRFQAVDGDWKQAYYAFRGWTESKGCRTPKGYDPPVHWNELYDNEYFFKVCAACDHYVKPDGSGLLPAIWIVNKKLLADCYTRDMMLAEAAKAKELGCQALYMDPGWDTNANQQIWDEARLAPLKAWVGKMRAEFGLKVSLWCSLGEVPPTYGDPEACPPNARVVDENGKATDRVCCPSPAYLATKEKRLADLADAGIAFFMFDSDQFSGPCWDKKHGHHVPSTREDHAKALLELARRLRTKHPTLLIELHDPISGPSGIHYTPTYYGYDRKDSFTELWGHEFMWAPMDDILSRRAVSLYYFNLAYDIPLYLHVNLKQDNENSLIFWWFASTCRHLGVGGKPPTPVWEAEKRSMKTYLALKRFYTRGVFYGLGEEVHVHTLPDLHESVIDAFNLDDAPITRTIKFRLNDVGLPNGQVKVDGATVKQEGAEVEIDLSIPARGHRLVRIGV